MKNLISKIFLLITTGFLMIPSNGHAQSCHTLKEIFENSDYCDNKKISIAGVISEVLGPDTLIGSKYVFGFLMIDENKNTIRVVSVDEMVLIDGNAVVVDGRYYKKLYADGFNLNDTIVASSDNIKVILTARELLNDILGPYGESLNISKKLAIQNKIFMGLA